MNIGIFEDAGWQSLLPLTWLRPAFDLRCGRERLIEAQRRCLPGRPARLWLRPELRPCFEPAAGLSTVQSKNDWFVLNARALVDRHLPELPVGHHWRQGDSLIAARLSAADGAALGPDFFLDPVRLRDWMARRKDADVPTNVRLIDYPWDLVHASISRLADQLRDGGVHEGRVHPGAHLVNPGAIYIGAGAVLKPGVVLDAEDGPIHIERDALLEPNAVVQGPAYIGEGAVLRPNSIIRPYTVIGPVCRVGGEVAESVLWGYANKQHDGFLGHSYVGPWVNLGAGTITSDLKNTYGAIRCRLNGVEIETGHRFLGSILGDHCKTGIGTVLGTGTIVGISASVFTPGPVPRFVPSFAWFTYKGLEPYQIQKAIETARTVMGRRKVQLSQDEARLIEHAAAEARTIETPGWRRE